LMSFQSENTGFQFLQRGVAGVLNLEAILRQSWFSFWRKQELLEKKIGSY